MTYSCSDFYDDVMRCLVDADVVHESDREDGTDTIGADADLAIAGIARTMPMAAAARFLDELINAAATLEGVAEQYGVKALGSLMYLQAAIRHESRLEVPRSESEFLDVIRALPSAKEWLRHIEIVG